MMPYKKGFNFILLIGLIVQIIACAPNAPLEEPVANKPEVRVFELKPELVLQAVEKVLAKKKYVLKSGPNRPLFLETEWLQDGPYRSMVKAEIGPVSRQKSQLTVQILLENKSTWEKSWRPVDQIGKYVYKEFMDDVQMESYRVLYDQK